MKTNIYSESTGVSDPLQVNNIRPRTGATVTVSGLDANSQTITSVGYPIAGDDAATKTYVDTAVDLVDNIGDDTQVIYNNAGTLAGAPNLQYLVETGTTLMTNVRIGSLTERTPGGNISVTSLVDMSNNKIVNLGTPTLAADATTKSYVDAAAAIPNATTTAINVTTTNNTAVTGATVATVSNRSYVLMIVLSTYCTVGANVGSGRVFRLTQRAKNVAGTVTIGAALENLANGDAALNTVSIALAVSGTGIQVRITGINANTLVHAGYVQTVVAG